MHATSELLRGQLGEPALNEVIKLELSYLTLYNGECEETRWSFA